MSGPAADGGEAPERRDWGFLVDENPEPEVASTLRKADHRAEHVQEVLAKGVDDVPDLLPLAREDDLVVVTADVSDFAAMPTTIGA